MAFDGRVPPLALAALLAVWGGQGLAQPPPSPAADEAARWWTKAPDVPEAKDPLGGRRANRAQEERAGKVTSGASPLFYRLWGLQPLQQQVLRPGEAVVELWMRPQDTVRQAVIRITLRDDGRAFLQARAGMGCCTAEIGRRVDIDTPLASNWAYAVKRLVDDPAWGLPENVDVDEGGGMVDAVCVGGVAYDLALLTAARAVHLRRACGGPEYGSAADVLSTVIGAAMGHDPRFDALFPRGADFAADKAAYRDLFAEGGKLKPAAVR